jgi:glutathione S-transferase
MENAITLYGSGGARSLRCRWVLSELGLEYEYIDESGLIGSDRLREFHPQSKIPAAVINGIAIFESSAICCYLCDLNQSAGLIASPGSSDRALHDQWVSFAQSEVEGYLWSNIKHKSLYSEERRVPEVIHQNTIEIHAGLKVMDAVLGRSDYLVGNNFSVTDIIVGWTINWARRSDLLGDYQALSQYLSRLFQRQHCMLNPD